MPATQTASGQRPQASARKNAIRLVTLASAANLARDIFTPRTVVVAAIVVVAAARLVREGRNPLDWYFAHGQDERRNPI